MRLFGDLFLVEHVIFGRLVSLSIYGCLMLCGSCTGENGRKHGSGPYCTNTALGATRLVASRPPAPLELASLVKALSHPLSPGTENPFIVCIHPVRRGWPSNWTDRGPQGFVILFVSFRFPMIVASRARVGGKCGDQDELDE
ncbi:hypothetical protein LZ32DRAFT_156532 [Colletotrichum eremochloae]|nr:hypothetical protein LY78DRAFT_46999 [Colletotrichum sublineola]KAK2015377.1 hypothetical protein LZ32DRAFT_156532 [Colletotrichum eremochloae]